MIPRDFGQLSHGVIAVEVEEIVTSTNTLSFDDYRTLRTYHLMMELVYNGKAMRPLFKMLKESEKSIDHLMRELVNNAHASSYGLQNLISRFNQETRARALE